MVGPDSEPTSVDKAQSAPLSSQSASGEMENISRYVVTFQCFRCGKYGYKAVDCRSSTKADATKLGNNKGRTRNAPKVRGKVRTGAANKVTTCSLSDPAVESDAMIANTTARELRAPAVHNKVHARSRDSVNEQATSRHRPVLSSLGAV